MLSVTSSGDGGVRRIGDEAKEGMRRLALEGPAVDRDEAALLSALGLPGIPRERREALERAGKPERDLGRHTGGVTPRP